MRSFLFIADRASGEGVNGWRGHGLFVATIYMAKMGGALSAHNRMGGVRFMVNRQRVIA